MWREIDDDNPSVCTANWHLKLSLCITPDNLKSNEDMIFALTGQFKQLSREPEKFR